MILAMRQRNQPAPVEARLDAIEAALERLIAAREAPAPEGGDGTEAPRRVKVQDPGFRRVAKMAEKDARTLLGRDRLWILWQAVRNVAPLGLPIAEVGSYRGGSAGFLARAWEEQTGTPVSLDAIDTFEGHPEGRFSDHDSEVHGTGLFGDTSFDDVRGYLARWPGVRVHQGEFGAIKGVLTAPSYGLAHIDVDLYEASLETLLFFDARLPLGGIMVLDDYDARKCPGVRAAAEAFVAQRPHYAGWHAHTEQFVLTKLVA